MLVASLPRWSQTSPREELWWGGLSRERPPYSERSLPRGRPHRNQGHVALAVVSRICPTFSVLVDGALSCMPRALMNRIQCVPIPAARSDIPALHGLLPRKGRLVSAGQSSRHGKARSVSLKNIRFTWPLAVAWLPVPSSPRLGSRLPPCARAGVPPLGSTVATPVGESVPLLVVVVSQKQRVGRVRRRERA